MAKTIAVMGATGIQGGSVVKLFLSKGWNVRGITRSTISPSAKDLASKGVEVVEGDADKPESLILAFTGAHAIFAVTDFWAPFLEKYAELSQISDRATGEYALEVEVKRGKAIVDAVEHVLKQEGSVLERFVLSTLPSFKDASGGKYTYIYHFDGKAMVSEYLRGNGELWDKSSLLNLGFYASNLVNMGEMVGVGMNDGVMVWQKSGANDAIHPFIVTEDTGILVDLLVRSPPKQDLLGVSEFASYKTLMNSWTEATGVPSDVKDVSVEDFDRARPGGLAKEAAESNASSAEFGWGKNLVLPTQLDSNIKMTTLKQYMEGVDWKAFFGKK